MDKKSNIGMAGVIGAIGALASLVYFIMATSTEGFTTKQLIQILLVVFAGVGAMLVGFMSKNTSTTYLLPFGAMILSFLLSASIYMDTFLDKKTAGPSAVWWYSTTLGQSIFNALCAVALLITYFEVIDKIKGKLSGLMMTTTIMGGYVFNFVINCPQKIYSYFGDVTTASMQITLKGLIIFFLQYISAISVLLAMAVIVCGCIKKNEKADEE